MIRAALLNIGQKIFEVFQHVRPLLHDLPQIRLLSVDFLLGCQRWLVRVLRLEKWFWVVLGIVFVKPNVDLGRFVSLCLGGNGSRKVLLFSADRAFSWIMRTSRGTKEAWGLVQVYVGKVTEALDLTLRLDMGPPLRPDLWYIPGSVLDHFSCGIHHTRTIN